jgi:hypothetical protein
MANDYYNHGGFPATGSAGTSATARAEFDAIMAGFAKLPVLAAAGLKLVRVNAGATALESTSLIDGISIGSVTPAAGAFTTLSAAGSVTLISSSSGTLGNSLKVTIPGGQGFYFNSLTAGAVNTLAVGSNEVFNLNVGGSTAISISGNRNVTINAPSSGAALTVNGVTGSTGLTVASSNGITASQSGTGLIELRLQRTAGTTSDWEIYSPSGSSDLRFFSGADRVTFAAAGNVTIAAPASGVTLTATSGSGAEGFRQLGRASDDVGTFELYNNANTTRLGYLQGTSSDTILAADGARNIQLYTNSLGRVTVNSAGNVTIAAPTSGTALAVNGSALTPTSTQAFSATPTFNAALANVFEMNALTANVTSMTISNPVAGQTVSIRLIQDATGGRTVASPAGAKISGSMGATASAASILTLTYSSGSARWEGSWLNLPA